MGRNKQGYTIVETMIFLAISGLMFVMAAVFISGKQGTAEFRQGMNDINSNLQQVINDVGNGFYPSNSGFTCSSSGSDLAFTSATSTTQGANLGCVFLGKVVQFGANSNTANYYVYSVAGTQLTTAKTTPANFGEAVPRVIYTPDLTDKKVLQWGVQATAMYDNNGTTPLSAIGFFGSFGGGLQSGSQVVNVVAINPNTDLTTTSGSDEPTMAGTTINAGIVDSHVRPHPNILICFKGSANQYGSVTIGGGSGQKLTTAMKISTTSISGCPA